MYRLLFTLCWITLLGNGCSGDGANFASSSPIDEETEVGPDDLLKLDTRTGSRKHLLTFKTSGKHEFGRYLSEYVLVIKSNTESCVRLKVRPAEEIGTPIARNYFDNDDPGASSCGAGGGGKAEGAKLALLPDIDEKVRAQPSHATAVPIRAEHQRYLDAIPADARRLGITSSPELCSISIFRMPDKRISRGAGDHGGDDYTVPKTGRLLVVSAQKKIRIWIDEEYGNPCRAVGQTPDNFEALEFSEQGASITDRLYMAHLHNLATEVEKAYTRLSRAFGEVSDVDDNGSIDVFLSPNVNRSHFNGYPSSRIDSFRATLPYRPNDLAPYDPRSNSTSNEGEIVYLWVPDPAGIYTYGFPTSSNSLTSNYSKGFVAAQLMNLIMLNQKTIVKKRLKREKRWLMEALSLLASSYIGGNNYVFHMLAQYLTSRPQIINAFAQPTSNYENIIDDEERQGMLTMFAWYMHTRLCGNRVEICADLKKLIDTDLVGKDNIENVFGVSLNQLMLDFGITVAAHLADDPRAVRGLWDKADSGTEGLAKPLEMPLFDDNNLDATEVSSHDPPVTVELANDGNTFISGDPHRGAACNRIDDRACDRTHASPFPNLSNMLYQVVLPDSDMDLKLVNNSVTYIFVTGLTAKRTDIVANFGRGLQIVIMPLGERNADLRKVHQEKVSEFGHMDVRAVNLTDTVDATKTYYNDPPYPRDIMHEWTLKGDKELWIAGAIDDIKLNPMTIGDADTYNIKVDPCASGCSADDKILVSVQTKVRDYPSGLVPFTLATTTDLDMFKGRNIWAKAEDLDIPDFEPQGEAVFCQATSTNPGRCANGRISGAATFDARHQNSGGFALPVDNFLFASRPFASAQRFNNEVLACQERGGGPRPFCPEEAARQFFNFSWSKDSKAHNFVFYTLDEDTNFSESLETIGSEDVQNLQKFKRLLPNAPFNEDDEEGLSACSDIGLDEENDCRKKSAGQLRTAAQALLATKRFVCNHDAPVIDCAAIASDIGGWFPRGQFVNLKKSDQTWTTYYDPAFAKGGHGPCVGETQTTPPVDYPCLLEATMNTGDIRHQLNVDADRVLPLGDEPYCMGVFGVDFDVCVDPVTIYSASGAGDQLYTYVYNNPNTTRIRERCPFDLSPSRGEVIGKSDRVHYLWFEVRKDAPTFINLMVGGLNNSKGRYLLRAKMFKFTDNRCSR